MSTAEETALKYALKQAQSQLAEADQALVARAHYALQIVELTKELGETNEALAACRSEALGNIAKLTEAEVSLEMLAGHACVTGDCPHSKAQGCVDSLVEAIKIAAQS